MKFTKIIENVNGTVWLYIYRDGIRMDTQIFQWGTLEGRYKRAHNWADKQIELAEKYEIHN
jgi:hypothetical protein